MTPNAQNAEVAGEVNAKPMGPPCLCLESGIKLTVFPLVFPTRPELTDRVVLSIVAPTWLSPAQTFKLLAIACNRSFNMLNI